MLNDTNAELSMMAGSDPAIGSDQRYANSSGLTQTSTVANITTHRALES
jgi:hypothetical protein